MKTASRSPIRRTARRVKVVWSELDRARRRVFEIPTGRDLDRRGKRSQAELDALYAVPPSKRPLPR